MHSFNVLQTSDPHVIMFARSFLLWHHVDQTPWVTSTHCMQLFTFYVPVVFSLTSMQCIQSQNDKALTGLTDNLTNIF